MNDACQEGADIAEMAKDFVASGYHDLGMIAKAAIVLHSTENTSDPIAVVLKGLFATALAATETDTEAILTAMMLHYVATPAQRPTWSSHITKLFIP